MAPVACASFWWWICFLAVLWINICYSRAYLTTHPFAWPTTFDYGTNNIRLVDGFTPSEGRVEIFYSGEWNTICDEGWGVEEAQVVCRQLGYGAENAVERNLAYYGQGSGPILQAFCGGLETRLENCYLTSSFCFHFEDAGVECGDAPPTPSPYPWPTPYGRTIRLMDGNSSREGRVEIFYYGQWNTICDDYWDLDEAKVACRQLGYDSDGAIARTSAYFGEGSGPIRSIQCYGYESSLSTCTNTPADSVCYHFEDAGVTCRQTKTSSRVIGVMSFVGVALFLLTISAMVAVLYTCRKQHKPTPAPREMVPLSTVTTTPAPASHTATGSPLQVDIPVEAGTAF